ncbi:MAG: archease [Nitrososphaerota archaeon]|nr:archease [Nitrososphaerota archaeon]
MGYKRLEHVSDAYIEAYGRSKNTCFESAALSLLDLIYDVHTVQSKVEVNFSVSGSDEYNLLYRWLEAVLQKFTIEELAISRFSVRINDNTLNATGYGEPYKQERHGYKTEVKGITYYLMEIVHQKGWWRVKYLADL